MPKPGQAHFVVHWAKGGKQTVLCQFNPTEISIEKGVQLAEIAIPGLTAPIQQFVRGQAETLNLELFFDTTEHGMGAGAVSVTKLTDPIYAMARIDPDSHAPPTVTFVWGREFPGHRLPDRLENQRRESFDGVVASVRQTFSLWSPHGVPLRAKLSVALKQYLPFAKQLEELNLNSPDKTRSHVLARGETLDRIAGQYYQASGDWRPIANANHIEDPRRLRPGIALRVPSIQTRDA